MRKSFATDDHAELLKAADGKAFTFFERDKGKFGFTKSASEVISRQDMQNFAPPDDHFGVHLITMGAEEMYGANRNGDSASINSLQTYHPTFEKYGCVYKEHANKDPKTQGVGQVKLARYNPHMHRGELIVWVSKDKAPDMFKEAKDGKELSWSMSMRLPYDECSCCGKKSRTTADYCADLRDHMLEYVEKRAKYAYARNEKDVKFFDISKVARRADRQATYLRYAFPGEMAKAASANRVITGAAWADFYHHDDAGIAEFTAWEELTLEKLAKASQFVIRAPGDVRASMLAMSPVDLSDTQIQTLASDDFRSVAGELSKRAMLINFKTFASLITGQTIADLQKNAALCQASAQLPELLSSMLQAGGSACGAEVASSVAPDECGCAFSPRRDAIDVLLKEVGQDLGMDQESLTARAVTASVIKEASQSPRAVVSTPDDAYYNGLVQAYGHYLVKAAHYVKTVKNVSENALFRAIAAGLTPIVG